MIRKNSYKFLLFFFVMVFCLQACQKDNNNDPAVSTADRDKFIGTWITTSNGPIAGTLNFTMVISAGNSSASQIKISNFDGEGTGTVIFADVSGNNVSLTATTIGMDNISGTGYYNSNNTLSFNFTVNDGQHVDNRTATAHK